MRRPLVAMCVLVVMALAGPAVAATPADQDDARAEGSGEIVGGVATSITTRPFQVAVFPDGGLCGGVVIHPMFVLTARHCIEGLPSDATFTLRAGSSTYDVGGVTRARLWGGGGGIRAIITQAFSSRDLALIELRDPLPETAAIKPVRLIGVLQDDLVAPGMQGTVSGWGLTSEDGELSRELRRVEVPIQDDSVCADPTVYGTEFWPASELCAGPMAGGRDSCQGDSGGPLTVSGTGGPFLVGLVSWGEGCALPGFPGVYASVRDTDDWIRSHVALNDDLDDAIFLYGLYADVGTSQHASREVGEPLVAGAGANSVWYRCVADAAGTFSIDTEDSSFDTTLGVFQGDGVDALTTVATNDDDGALSTSRVTIDADEGDTYLIQVAAAAEDGYGEVRLHHTLPCRAESFPDVGRFSPFFADVEWLVGNDVTGGYVDGTFRPGLPVSRQALVAYLFRMAGSPAGPFPEAGFIDVGAAHPFHDEIAWAASVGVVGGYSDGTFRPGISLTRQAISALLHRYDDLP